MERRGAVLVTVWAVLAVAVIAAGVGLAVLTSQRSVSAGDRRWCAVLDLITSQPVAKPADPKANPSREGQYALYQDFLTLQREFGCHE